MKNPVYVYAAFVILAALCACAGPSENRLTGSDHWADRVKGQPW